MTSYQHFGDKNCNGGIRGMFLPDVADSGTVG